MPLLRTVGGRVRSFRFSHRAVVHHGQRIAEILDERVNSLLPDNLKVNFWFLMLAIVDLLRRHCDRLTGTENILVAERANDPRTRNERDQDSLNLRSKVQHFRDAFQTNYLPDNIEELGFPLALGETPFEVLRQTDYLVGTLGGPDVKIPEPRIGAGLPVADLVAELKTLADALRSSLDATDREVKLAELAVVDKDDAAADWDRLQTWAVRTITGLFTLAGRSDLAARVLPAPARRGLSGADDGEPEPPEGEEGGPTPPADGPGSEPPAPDASPPDSAA